MKKRKDSEFAYKKMLSGLLFVAGSIPFFIWIASQSYGAETDKKLTTSGWIGIAAFVAYAITAIVLIRRPEDHYCCPQCGTHIKARPHNERSNQEYQFQCAACGILWRTDVFEGDS
jgi:predicted RNA-binding Zn-ribbon protein involved in translation (DUF1610 family)